eukprot:957957-Amphidinium_carterae.1
MPQQIAKTPQVGGAREGNMFKCLSHNEIRGVIRSYDVISLLHVILKNTHFTMQHGQCNSSLLKQIGLERSCIGKPQRRQGSVDNTQPNEGIHSKLQMARNRWRDVRVFHGSGFRKQRRCIPFPRKFLVEGINYVM